MSKYPTTVLVPTFLTLSCLGIIFNPILPAQATSCRSNQTFGSIDFGNCQSITLVGGGVSINQYKKRQSAQFNVAITGYNKTIAANITQMQVAQTPTTWKLKNAELKIVALAIRPGNLNNHNSGVLMQNESTNPVALAR
jgi:hypothetical protein